MLDLGATPGLSYKLMDVQSYLPAIIKKHGRIYYDAVIPKGTYKGQDADVKTISVPVIFVTMDKMDEKLVYAITKTLFEKKADLVAVHKEAMKLNLKARPTSPRYLSIRARSSTIRSMAPGSNKVAARTA